MNGHLVASRDRLQMRLDDQRKEIAALWKKLKKRSPSMDQTPPIDPIPGTPTTLPELEALRAVDNVARYLLLELDQDVPKDNVQPWMTKLRDALAAVPPPAEEASCEPRP